MCAQENKWVLTLDLISNNIIRLIISEYFVQLFRHHKSPFHTVTRIHLISLWRGHISPTRHLIYLYGANVNVNVKSQGSARDDRPQMRMEGVPEKRASMPKTTSKHQQGEHEVGTGDWGKHAQRMAKNWTFSAVLVFTIDPTDEWRRVTQHKNNDVVWSTFI